MNRNKGDSCLHELDSRRDGAWDDDIVEPTALRAGTLLVRVNHGCSSRHNTINSNGIGASVQVPGGGGVLNATESFLRPMRILSDFQFCKFSNKEEFSLLDYS